MKTNVLKTYLVYPLFIAKDCFLSRKPNGIPIRI